jgi:hypothetical protein
MKKISKSKQSKHKSIQNPIKSMKIKSRLFGKGVNKTRKINLVKVNCSPKEKNKKKNFTCYTEDTLYKLRDLWNARHPDDLIQTNDTKEIHAALSKHLSNVCNKESCWLKQNFITHDVDKELMNYTQVLVFFHQFLKIDNPR